MNVAENQIILFRLKNVYGEELSVMTFLSDQAHSNWNQPHGEEDSSWHMQPFKLFALMESQRVLLTDFMFVYSSGLRFMNINKLCCEALSNYAVLSHKREPVKQSLTENLRYTQRD